MEGLLITLIARLFFCVEHLIHIQIQKQWDTIFEGLSTQNLRAHKIAYKQEIYSYANGMNHSLSRHGCATFDASNETRFDHKQLLLALLTQ